MSERPFKPNVAFLRKVEAGRVRRVCRYSAKKRGYYEFEGGEATALKHVKAGYIRIIGVPGLGRPVVATLTDDGRAFLEREGHE